MDHEVKFDLTPLGQLNESRTPGKQCMKIWDREFPLCFDGRKKFINIRRPTPHELDILEVFELTSPDAFDPDIKHEIIISRVIKTKNQEYPGSLTIKQWQARLGLAPKDVVKRTLDGTT